ncbi:MAG: response regulator [Synergistaceae bacterium]|jgi:putative two-component system response regulator|nr:response regulator [Synergistaceae bacterium]
MQDNNLASGGQTFATRVAIPPTELLNSILVVDDDATNLRLLQEILKKEYKVYAAPSGERALLFLQKQAPDLILLDVEMPGMSGYELIGLLKSEPKLRDIPVIFLTAQEGRDKEEQAFKLGAVDYILKPISSGVVTARVRLHLQLETYKKRLEQMVEHKTYQLQKAQDSILDILANITAFRDSDTGWHIERTTLYTKVIVDNIIAQDHPHYQINQDYASHIVKSAKLHDIGKVAVPDSILLKPARLSMGEFQLIKQHTTYGAQMIDDAIADLGDDSSFLHVAREIVISHHEWWNGTGYPNGLFGDAIPIAGRVMAIADVYDSLRSHRPYKMPMSHEETLNIMRKETGTHFDPVLMYMTESVFDSFQSIATEYHDEGRNDGGLMT